LPEFKSEGYIGKIAHIPKEDDGEEDDEKDETVSFINDVANTFGYFSPTPDNEDENTSGEINSWHRATRNSRNSKRCVF